MPPRRSHRKSRYGCSDCKKRRVKCNEVHPICGPCSARQQACSFQALTPTLSTPNNKTTSNISTRNNSPAQEEPSGLPQPTRLLELKLLHHFTTATSLAISHKRLDHLHYSCIVPKFALSHPVVLDVLFAVSALHLEHLDPRNPEKDWLKVALFYQARGLSGFNVALADITEDNCQEIALCSIFVAWIAVALPGLTEPNTVISPDGIESRSDPAAEFIGLRNLFQGSREIIWRWEKSLRAGEVGEYFSQVLDCRILEPVPERFESDEELNIFSSIPPAIKNMESIIRTQDNPNKKIYIEAYEALDLSLRPFLAGEDSPIISWPLQIDHLLLTLLEQKETMALILWMHYAVVLNLLGKYWTAKGAGKRLVLSLLPSLQGDVGREWSEVIEWAKHAVGVL